MPNHKSRVRGRRQNRRRVNLKTTQLGKKKSFEHLQVRTTYTHTRAHAHFTALNTRHSSPCDLPLTFAVHTVPHRLHISTSGHKECALISVETQYAYSAASFRSHIKLANSKLLAKPRSQHLYELGCGKDRKAIFLNTKKTGTVNNI